jgi:hypothetical protein
MTQSFAAKTRQARAALTLGTEEETRADKPSAELIRPLPILGLAGGGSAQKEGFYCAVHETESGLSRQIFLRELSSASDVLWNTDVSHEPSGTTVSGVSPFLVL